MLTALLSDFREAGHLSPQRIASRLHLSVADLSRITGVHRNTLAQRPASPAVQKSLEMVTRILAGAEQIAGDGDRAVIWFRHQPLPGFSGQTALDLVEAGHGNAVLTYLEELRDGAYA